MKSPRVLVVEDNPITRKLFRVTLEGDGFAVLEATDGRSAIAAMTTGDPDLVLQDLLLPDMDGFALVKALRDLPRGEQVAIVAVSGILSKLDHIRLTRSGFNDFLAKPVEPSRLIEVVRTFLPAEGPTRTSLAGDVLLVDDDPVQRKLVGIRLTHLGLRVRNAVDGQEALETARRQPPDLIVSDVLMPRLDGFGLCRAIREDRALAGVPVVLTSSSFVEDDDRRLARHVGANAMVVRTPDLSELMEAVRLGIRGVLPAAPVGPGPSVTRDYVDRLTRQLERQAAMNASLSQRCAIQASELAMLAGVHGILSRADSLENVLTEVLARCLDAGGLSMGALYLVGDEGRLAPVAKIGYAPVLSGAVEDVSGLNDLLSQVLTSGRALRLHGAPPRAGALEELLRLAQATSALLVPVRSRADSLGVLVLLGSARRDMTEEDWLPFAETAAAHIGQAIALRRAFDDLAASERRYRSLFERAGDGFVVTDPGRRIVDANPAMCRLSGYAIDELQGLDLADVLPAGPATAPGGNEPGSRDHELRRGDGQPCTVILSTSELDRGLSLTIVHDVSEHRRLQASLGQAEKIAVMGQLLAGVAHELNNPLAVVLGQAELLQRRLPDGPERERVGKMTTAARRCTRIVRNFLALARQRPSERQPTSLNGVVNDALEMLGYLLRVDDVEIDLRLTADLPILDADPHELHQVVVNLVTNAQQAMRETSWPRRLTITTRADAARAALILEVSDTGPGVPSEAQARIFEPFFTTKLPGQGTGLGLALCQGMIRSHGGTIEVESGPGRGATFRITLPVTRAGGADRGEELDRLGAVRNRRVLLVDDEAAVAETIAEILRLDGHHVEVVASGAVALAKLAEKRWDLVMADVRMPGVDGPTLYREAARYDARLARRFIFMTGDTLGPQTAAFLEDSGVPILEKPFDLDRVRTAVGTVLQAVEATERDAAGESERPSGESA